jgi:glycyl-tRNA synthetase
MSIALLPSAGLRWWTENELAHRELATGALNSAVRDGLLGINNAWTFARTEAPMLIPQSMISPAYGADDVFFLQRSMMGQVMVMRPETTEGSYMRARAILDQYGPKRLPLCVWQVGKSYRVEASDGASASRLRFNEFTQAEWQCVYREDTKADYRAAVMPALERTIGWLTGRQTRVVKSDRTPAYSELTMDVEVLRGTSMVEGVAKEHWTEMCSVSTRTDFKWEKGTNPLLVLEVAVGLDRVVDVATESGVVR